MLSNGEPKGHAPSFPVWSLCKRDRCGSNGAWLWLSPKTTASSTRLKLASGVLSDAFHFENCYRQALHYEVVLASMRPLGVKRRSGGYREAARMGGA